MPSLSRRNAKNVLRASVRAIKVQCSGLEGDIGVCGIAVLDHFSCDISGILISNCGIVVFYGPAGCGFLAFWAVLKIIVQVVVTFFELFLTFRLCRKQDETGSQTSSVTRVYDSKRDRK